MIELLLTIPKELQVIILGCIVMGVWMEYQDRREKWQQKDKKD